MESHIHSPSNPLEPHTFLKGRIKAFNFTFLKVEQLSVPCQLLKSVPSPLPLFSSQGRNECGSTGIEKDRKKYFWGKNQPISILLQQVFLYEDKQGERQVSLRNGGRVIPEAFANVYSGGILGGTEVPVLLQVRNTHGCLCSPSVSFGLCPVLAFPSGLLKVSALLFQSTCSWLSRICPVIPAN